MRAVDARDARGSPPSREHGVEVAVAGQVVRLLPSVGDEVDLRAVVRPAMLPAAGTRQT